MSNDALFGFIIRQAAAFDKRKGMEEPQRKRRLLEWLQKASSYSGKSLAVLVFTAILVKAGIAGIKVFAVELIGGYAQAFA